MKSNALPKNRFIVIFLLLLSVFSFAVSCSKSSSDNPAGTNEVLIQGFAFSPSTLTVTAGTTVTWTNKDAATHNVTSDNAVFSSGSMANGATFSFTFSDKGTFGYTCTIHPQMKGTIVVN